MPSRKIKAFLFYWGPVLLYSTLIFWLSSREVPPDLPRGADKILHFFEYFVFTFLLWRAFEQRGWRVRSKTLAVVLIAAIYAASDEVHQSLVPGRFASIYDWFADVAGILGMITLVLSKVKWRGAAVTYHYETT